METISIDSDTTRVRQSSKLRVVIQGNLVLNRAREDFVMDQVMRQFENTRKEMGYISKGQYQGHMLKRKEAWSEYENDFEHRKNKAKYGPLYTLFNNSVNIPKRAVRVFKARACEQLLNSEPFAGMTPSGIEDIDPGVKQGERYFQYKLKECGSKYALRDSIEQSGVSGETPIKITQFADRRTEQKTTKIYVDADGVPVRDSRNRFVREGSVEDDPDTLDGKRVKHDRSTKINPSLHTLSADMKTAVESLTNRKLDMKRVGWEDFWCPLSARDIFSAQAIHETFDMPMDKVWSFTQGLIISPEAKAWREGILSVSGEAKSGENQPRVRHGEEEGLNSGDPGVLGLCETYIRIDAENNGIPCEVYVLWQVDGNGGGYPIYYDYLTEVSQTGNRPYRINRIIPVRGRWYGMGFYELLSNEHNFIDRQWNRIDSRNSTSGRLTWVRDNAFTEQKFGIPIEFNNPRIYHLDAGVQDSKQAFGYYELPSVDENIWKMFSQASQAAQLMTGTITPSDAEASKLDITDTATGINSLTAESELMSGDTIQECQRGIFEALQDAALVVFMDFVSADDEIKKDAQEDLIDFVGSENAEQVFTWLQNNKPQKLLMHIRLLLTKARSKQQFEANMAIYKLLTGGAPWISLASQVQQGIMSSQVYESLKPVVKKIVTALDDTMPMEALLDYTPVSQVLAQPPGADGQPQPGGAPAPAGGQAPSQPPAGLLPQSTQAPLQNTSNFTPQTAGATGQAAFQSQKP